MATLKLGSKGEDVKKLQTALGITADGEFGPKTKEAVIAFQKNNGLEADGIVGPKTMEKILSALPKEEEKADGNEDIVIKKATINVHITEPKTKRKIKYLIIHYTAGSSSVEGKALATRNVFMQREASADFVVDDKTMVQINPDPTKYYCWAVGDKGDGRKKTIFNQDCISIEMCSSLKKGTSAAKPNHEGWYFTDEVVNNTLKLAKHLMAEYDIPAENVLRHFDVTGKMCPGIVGWNTGTVYTTSGTATKSKNTEEKWEEFKKRLSED